MSMVNNTLGRYFAGRFVVSALGVFASIFVLLVLVDYIEMVRKTSGLAAASPIMVAETSLFRVPQLLEKMMPFCVLIGAMTCYLALSRRLELVVARAAGVSAWQFMAPALVERHPARRARDRRLQSDVGQSARALQAHGGGAVRRRGRSADPGRRRFWINQANSDGQMIMNAARSEKQGVRLTGLTLFRFDTNYRFKERIEAREATLDEGRWLFRDVRRFALDAPPVDQPTLTIATELTPAQVRNSFRLRKLCRFGNCRPTSARPKVRALRPPAIGCNTTSFWHSRFCLPQW